MNPRSWRSIGDYQHDMFAATMLLRMIFVLIRLTPSYVRLMWPDLHIETHLDWIWFVWVSFFLCLSLFTNFNLFCFGICTVFNQLLMCVYKRHSCDTMENKTDELAWLWVRNKSFFLDRWRQYDKQCGLSRTICGCVCVCVCVGVFVKSCVLS